MTRKEAEALLDLIQLELGVTSAKTHQIGNGSHVVIIHHMWFCWQFSDWPKYLTTVVNYPSKRHQMKMYA
jgi:hypothetical protein